MGLGSHFTTFSCLERGKRYKSRARRNGLKDQEGNAELRAKTETNFNTDTNINTKTPTLRKGGEGWGTRKI
jgi:hypothetical protein